VATLGFGCLPGFVFCGGQRGIVTQRCRFGLGNGKIGPHCRQA
tara:strand:+ start:484 stop:612 length:129 start_codon:yes stop_codon:yes gene_type:complete